MELFQTIIVAAIVSAIISAAFIFVYHLLDQRREKNAPENDLKKEVKKIAESFEISKVPIAIGSEEHFFLILDEKMEKTIMFGDATAMGPFHASDVKQRSEIPQVIQTMNHPLCVVLDKLERRDEAWIIYQVNNTKRSIGSSGKLYLFKKDGYVFGGGFRN